MREKDKVLVCLGPEWSMQTDIAKEFAFVHRDLFSVIAVPTILFLYQLRGDGLAEANELSASVKHTVWRLTKAGEVEKQRLLEAYPSVARAKEEYLLVGVPT